MLSIRHESLTYMMKQNLENFAEINIKDIENQWQVAYASNNEHDTDQVGQVAYLKGFYIRAARFDQTGMATVKNFIAYIDAFVRHRRETDARSRIPMEAKFVITNYTNLDLEFEPDVLGHEAEIHAGQEPMQAVLKLQPPVQSRRFLVVDFDFGSEGKLKVGFSGETYAYREHFASFNVPGIYVDASGGVVERDTPDCEYIRTLPEASLDDEDQVRWILDFLGAKGIHKTVYVFRVVARAPGDATAAAAFLAKVFLETRGVQVLVV